MNKNKNIIAVVVLLVAAGCSTKDGGYVPRMDWKRKVSEQDCSRQIANDGGNLMCRELSERQRRARLAEEERQARAKREAEERATRERLERERAEQLARDEAARKQRAAEEERLAAERRRLEAEAAAAAALKAQEERERRERAEAEARERQERAEAEARARELAEQEAREAAERECRRLAQERADGRALLVSFVDNYSEVEENKGIAKQITAFLSKTRNEKPCPPVNSTPQLKQASNQLAKPRQKKQ